MVTHRDTLLTHEMKICPPCTTTPGYFFVKCCSSATRIIINFCKHNLKFYNKTMPVSNWTLAKIAGIGGIITASMGFALRFKLNKQINQSEYYKEALQTVRSHPGALHLLGQPIRAGAVDVGNDETNWTRELSAHYEVPIKGSKQDAVLFFWAERSNPEDSWRVNRIELELSNEPNRRLLVKNVTSE